MGRRSSAGEEHVATLRAITAQTASELHELVLSAAVGAGDAPAGLAGIRALATRASVCGLPVELYAEGAETHLPPDAARAAYRIVQEAITNAARHAPGASIQVRALCDPEGLALEISNEPPHGSRFRTMRPRTAASRQQAKRPGTRAPAATAWRACMNAPQAAAGQ